MGASTIPKEPRRHTDAAARLSPSPNPQDVETVGRDRPIAAATVPPYADRRADRALARA